jgi:hypothetical protein
MIRTRGEPQDGHRFSRDKRATRLRGKNSINKLERDG